MNEKSSKSKRTRLTRPYPTHTLEGALGVPEAIQNVNSGLPFDREHLAGALGTTPSSSAFTMRLNASAKYGLTQGGYADKTISLTSLGEAIVAPRGEEERIRALVEASTHPDIFSRFYGLLDGKRLPDDTYARNLLQRELEVNQELTSECLQIIKDNGLYSGVLRESQDGLVVDLGTATVPTTDLPRERAGAGTARPPDPLPVIQNETISQAPAGRVFVCHGAHSEAAEYLLSLLDQFRVQISSSELSYREGQPVSDRVAQEMKSCTAAVFVLDDRRLSNAGAAPEGNQDLLFHIGAASVLYGEKVLLYVDGASTPAGHEAVASVTYDRSRIADSGLDLVMALHKAGIIRVVA
ncbi:MAG: nucleotide-binding protein [Chloroflexi bacterium]|nr:nucleotide-binding protein [Chloroflexota bacterium]